MAVQSPLTGHEELHQAGSKARNLEKQEGQGALVCERSKKTKEHISTMWQCAEDKKNKIPSKNPPEEPSPTAALADALRRKEDGAGRAQSSTAGGSEL